jgi:hypothetical protein
MKYIPKLQTGGTFTQHSDATRITLPPQRIQPIKPTRDYFFNMKNFGQATAPTTQTFLQPKGNESVASRQSAQKNIETRERLDKFKQEQALQKQREMQAMPIIGMGAMTLAAPV